MSSRLLLPGFLALLLVACDGAAPPKSCSAATCSGCCTAAGTCEPGSLPQACGTSGLLCTTCSAGLTCQVGICVGSSTCRPTSCVAAGKTCGSISDGCGGTLNCGTCEVPGESCGGGGVANVCGAGTCTPQTCATQGKNCGRISDGCGALLECGTCTVQGETCGGSGTPNVCGAGACTPATCQQLGKNCGVVADGCGGQLSCGQCSVAGETCGGGGVPNVCGRDACVPRTCQQAGATCGAVSDGCGNTLSCGTCQGFETCGGAGTANTCGALCAQSCPTGFSCQGGVCSGGNLQSLVLDVMVPPQHTVSGTVRINNTTPTALTSCGNWQYIQFKHLTDSRYDTTARFGVGSGSCTYGTAWTWSAQLYPGSYKVTVEQDNNTSALPEWDTEVLPSFTVQAAQSGVVLDVMVPPQHTVSGTVRINNTTPTALTSCGNWQYIQFKHLTDSRYDTTARFGVGSGSCTYGTAWTWSAQLYPGTYKVTVEQDNNTSALPEWNTEVLPSFTVQAPQSGVVLDVMVPPQHTVSGTVRINNTTPTALTSCGNWQYIQFKHLTDSRYDTTARFGVGSGSCTYGTAWTWSAQLYPGTYKVTVEQDNNTSALPEWDTEVLPSFTVQAAQSGVVLNVLVPTQHTVSGTVRVNGATPAALTSCGNWQYIQFKHVTDSRYDTTARFGVGSGSCTYGTAWTWTAQLYPGTYKVTVEQDNNTSALPEWNTEVLPSFTVQAAQSGVVLDVMVPPQRTVSGTVRINGATPTALTSCGNWQYIQFKHLTDSRYDTTARFGVGSGSCTYGTAWTWTAQLYPGTYEVTVEQDNNTSALPEWDTVVVGRIAVP
ncbi:MAG: hypothetical protein ACOZQL_20015 [Myxococcota bacterium]